MSLLSALFDALAGDPPVAKTRPLSEPVESPDGEVSRAFMEAIRERKAWRARAIAFERQLRTHGYTTKKLDAVVELYDRGIRTDADVRAQG